MSRSDTPLQMPQAPGGGYNTVGSPGAVLTYQSVTMQGVSYTIPTKTVTIHNDTKQTIYPYFYDPNTGQAKGTNSWLDPFDAHNEEYRAYIGYQVGTTDYLGLQHGQWITMDVPLVFWDSGRIAFATSPVNFLPSDKNVNPGTGGVINPMQFFYYGTDKKTPTARYVVPAVASSQNNGLIMYYHCDGLARGPTADALVGYGESTFRDKAFLTAVSEHFSPPNPIPKDYLNTSVNYDVSYVNSILLPIAMEATKVPVPNNPGVAADYGWIGARIPLPGGRGQHPGQDRQFHQERCDEWPGELFPVQRQGPRLAPFLQSVPLQGSPASAP